jgi:hypothetical protein
MRPLIFRKGKGKMNYWKGWAVITAVYVIAWIWQRRYYKREIATMECQVLIFRKMTEDFIKRIRELREENDKLKGAKGE